MGSPEPVLLRAARWLTLGSAVSVLFSIAACQILLALALAALLFSGAKLRLPPIWLPLGLFLLATLISLSLSDNPTLGLPQVRKFYVFLELVVVFSTLRDVVLIRRLFLCWAAVGAVLALRGFVQFAAKVREAHALGQRFYDFYVPARITGFMSHWMTYSGQEMFILLMLAAFLFFAPGTGRLAWLWGACGVLVGVGLAARRCPGHPCPAAGRHPGLAGVGERALPIDSAAFQGGFQRLPRGDHAHGPGNDSRASLVRPGAGGSEVPIRPLRAAGHSAPAAGRLVRTFAQHLSALRGGARHSGDADPAVAAGPQPVRLSARPQRTAPGTERRALRAGGRCGGGARGPAGRFLRAEPGRQRGADHVSGGGGLWLPGAGDGARPAGGTRGCLSHCEDGKSCWRAAPAGWARPSRRSWPQRARAWC